MSNAISVTLIGAGLMGHGMGQVFARAGHSVVITGSAHRRTSHRHEGGTGLAEWTPAQAEAVHDELASHLIKMTAR